MKVVFLVSNLMCGGVERTVTYLASYFCRSGVETTILSISNEVFYDIDESVELIQLGIDRKYTGIVDRFRKAIQRYIDVNKIISKNKYDVIFCMAPEMIRYLAHRRNSNHYILISSERNNPLFDNEKEKKIKKKAFPRCDGIVFQTERARDFYPESIAKKGIVIPNAVGNELAYSIKATGTKMNKFSAIGRLSEQKDYPTMLKAFSAFLNHYPEYHLEIFGAGSEKERLIKLSRDLGIVDNVIFMGTSQNAIEHIVDAKAFLMSSRYEGMPNALMEAMAIGLPCISTDCPFGPAELINDGINGLLVEVGNEESLCNAMKYIVENADEAVKMGIEASRILNTNNVGDISEKYLNYIRKFFEDKKCI